jgi:isocitrate dehydrogenase
MTKITVAKEDGIGPEIMDATLEIILAAGAKIKIEEIEVAEKVQNAWLKTLEDDIHTYDIFKEGTRKIKAGTKEFAAAVIGNLGHKPSLLKAVSYANNETLILPKHKRKPAAKKELVGIDIFVPWNRTNPNELGAKIKKIENDTIKLTMITNRGVKVWPNGFDETFCTDHWRCRFKPNEDSEINKTNIIGLLQEAFDENVDTIKTENLHSFDGKSGYSLGQGQ